MKMFVTKDVENGKCRGTADRIAAEGAEKLHATGERGGDFGSGDHSRERERVRDGLAENNDVRDNTLRLESPEMRTKPAEADLHFVGNADCARSADVRVDFAQVAKRKDDLAGDTRKRFCNEGRDTTPFPFRLFENFGDSLRVLFVDRRFASAVQAAIVVGDGSDMDPRFATGAAGTVEFVGANVDECGSVTVVGVLENDDVFAMGKSARKAKRQFVGLGAGVEEIAEVEGRGEEGGEPFGIAIDVVVEVAGVGVEQADLLLNGRDDAGVGVADEGDIVVNVEESAAGVVVKILAPTFDDFQRLLVRDGKVGAQKLLARRERERESGRGRGKHTVWDRQNQVGIRGKGGEKGALRNESYPREIGREVEQVENDLEMQVRGPAPIFGNCAHRGEGLGLPNVLADVQFCERFAGKMAVEGEEFRGDLGLMSKDDDGAIVLRGSIVGEGVNGGVKRSGNERAGFNEQVNAEMDGAALVCGIRGSLKKRRRVSGARLVVTANGNSRAALGDQIADFRSHLRFGGVRGIRPQKCAAYAEIKHDTIAIVKIRGDDRSGRVSIRCQPGSH